MKMKVKKKERLARYIYRVPKENTDHVITVQKFCITHHRQHMDPKGDSFGWRARGFIL
jgi:hypothetical protein